MVQVGKAELDIESTVGPERGTVEVDVAGLDIVALDTAGHGYGARLDGHEQRQKPLLQNVGRA
jgi:hypothetical protein